MLKWEFIANLKQQALHEGLNLQHIYVEGLVKFPSIETSHMRSTDQTYCCLEHVSANTLCSLDPFSLDLEIELSMYREIGNML